MQSGKWTVEGAVKPLRREYSATQRQRYGRGVCWHSAKARGKSANQGGTEGLYSMPVLVILQGRAFLFSGSHFQQKYF